MCYAFSVQIGAHANASRRCRSLALATTLAPLTLCVAVTVCVVCSPFCPASSMPPVLYSTAQLELKSVLPRLSNHPSTAEGKRPREYSTTNSLTLEEIYESVEKQYRTLQHCFAIVDVDSDRKGHS